MSEPEKDLVVVKTAEPSSASLASKQRFTRKIALWLLRHTPSLSEAERREALEFFDTPFTGFNAWLGRLVDRLVVIFLVTDGALVALKCLKVLPIVHWPWSTVLRPLWEFIPLTLIIGIVLASVVEYFKNQ